MSFRLSALWSRTPAERPARPDGGRPRFRPVLEGFEDRVVPAAPPLNAALEAPLQAQVAVNNLVITDVDLTDFAIVDGVLTASGTVTGTLAGLPFTTEITNFALQLIPDDPETEQVECSVLDLELGPINLALLGLHVDTSPICLEITAVEGGGLLGDLLCGLAGGGGLGVPSLPTVGQVGQLIDGLINVLNGALNFQPAGPGGGSSESVCTGETEILELAIGPLNLSLLGLNVSLDDCNDGPVQVCVSATASEGLLGGLLAFLGNSSFVNLDFADITQLASRAADLIEDGTLSLRDRISLIFLFARLSR
jgi:hypothetical protein